MKIKKELLKKGFVCEFDSLEQKKEFLKWLEDNTGYEWPTGSKPTQSRNLNSTSLICLNGESKILTRGDKDYLARNNYNIIHFNDLEKATIGENVKLVSVNVTPVSVWKNPNAVAVKKINEVVEVIDYLTREENESHYYDGIEVYIIISNSICKGFIIRPQKHKMLEGLPEKFTCLVKSEDFYTTDFSTRNAKELQKSALISQDSFTFSYVKRNYDNDDVLVINKIEKILVTSADKISEQFKKCDLSVPKSEISKIKREKIKKVIVESL